MQTAQERRIAAPRGGVATRARVAASRTYSIAQNVDGVTVTIFFLQDARVLVLYESDGGEVWYKGTATVDTTSPETFTFTWDQTALIGPGQPRTQVTPIHAWETLCVW